MVYLIQEIKHTIISVKKEVMMMTGTERMKNCHISRTIGAVTVIMTQWN